MANNEFPSSESPKKRKSRKPIKLREIKVYDGDKTKLKDEFETTFYTVRRALDGYTNSALGYEIREAAINEYGGKYRSDTEIPDNNVPNNSK